MMNKIVCAAPDLNFNILEAFVTICENYLVFLRICLSSLLEFIFRILVDS